jgi:hypothetical protein
MIEIAVGLAVMGLFFLIYVAAVGLLRLLANHPDVVYWTSIVLFVFCVVLLVLYFAYRIGYEILHTA